MDDFKIIKNNRLHSKIFYYVNLRKNQQQFPPLQQPPGFIASIFADST